MPGSHIPSWSIFKLQLLLVTGFLGITSCRTVPPVGLKPSPSATARVRSEPRPSTTPTPTPTAPPFEVRDAYPILPQTTNPLGLVVRCEVADAFDYPIDPPNAESALGGGDFGVFRDRYHGYHTGEDWWYERRASLGKPVFSIGNGRVRYAAPNGWGDDLGTLVIEHIMRDGKRLYSFYGHIDPKSLTLSVGMCVRRGEQVGLIGDPRSSPHLHFEIRTIFADSPGPGYWSIDPSKSGWLPPSQTIEFSRYAADQRLIWWRAIAASRVYEMGWLSENLMLIVEGNELVVREVRSGVDLLREPIDEIDLFSSWDARAKELYVVEEGGELRRFTIDMIQYEGEQVVSLSEIGVNSALESPGRRKIIPFEFGVLQLAGDTWEAYSRSGELHWRVEEAPPIQNWIEYNGGIIAAAGGEDGHLWNLSRASAQPWVSGLVGKLFVLHGIPYLYARDGFYRLAPEKMEAEEVVSWNTAQMNRAGAFPGLNGEIILVHRDANDHRLILLDGMGVMEWNRSLFTLGSGKVQVETCAGSRWLLLEQSNRSGVVARLLQLLEDGRGEAFFQTFIRVPNNRESTLSCTPDQDLLLTLGGERQLLLDLQSQQPGQG